MKKYIVLIGLCYAISASAQIKDAESLIRKMHKKYHGNFNRDITFVQLNEDYDENGKVIKHSTSFETFHYPGKFRNDIGPLVNKDGYIIINDSIYLFKNGKVYEKRYTQYDVGLLTGDLYFMKIDDALNELKRHGYNLSVFREDMWRGKPVYVVGAQKGDERSPQFWIDQEELYIVRDINFSVEENKLQDIRFLEHAKVEKAWVEERIEIYVNGKLVRKEHYAEVKANSDLDLKIFDPNAIGKVHWRK